MIPPGPAGFGASTGQTVLWSPDAAKGGGGGGKSGGGSGGGSPPPPPPPTTSPSPFVINITWDSSVSSAPSGFQTAVMNTVQYLESHFTDPVTINIAIGYGEVGGTTLGSGALGESMSYLSSVSYSNLVSALSADATTAADASAVASLPSSSPVSGATYWTTTAEAKALGLAAATGTSLDGYVGFSSSLPFTYNDTNGVASGTYDFNAVVLHELTEVMGRQLLTGGTLGGTANSYSLYDLFHYSSPGVRDFSAATPGYFSIDSGTTSLAAFNTQSGGDAGDWASTVTSDAFDAFSGSGVVNTISSADLTAMDILGWNPATGGTGGTTAPTGVAIAPVTSALAAAANATGFAANVPLATITEVGGNSGDSYTYTLGGAGAGSFGLGSSGNTLTTGASGVAGSTAGTVYDLTLTANDTTNATASPAAPLAVVVGTGGADAIKVASLVAAASTPTFIYGGAGADSLDGSGMTGTLLFAGGAGGDTMTGGSGVNEFLYGAVGDSMAAAMDVIRNFNAATDLIDLSGISTTLGYAGQIHNTKIGAGAVGWQQSGGSTFIYVNTSGSNESLSAADMKIELAGNVALSGNNFYL